MPGRYIPGDNGTRPDDYVVTNVDVAEQACAGPDEDAVADYRGFFAFYTLAHGLVPQGYVLKDDRIPLKDRLPVDDHAQAIVQEANPVIHHYFRGQVAGVLLTQPSPHQLSRLVTAIAMEAIREPPQLVVPGVHALRDLHASSTFQKGVNAAIRQFPAAPQSAAWH